MTWTRTARLVLLCLALVTLAGAETLWSLALSTAPEPECRSASDADAAAVAEPRCCRKGNMPGGDSIDLAPCPCCSSALMVLSSLGD